MTKKFVFMVTCAVLAIIAIVVTIVLICIGSRDFRSTENGIVATPKSVSRLYELIEKEYDSLILDLSKMEYSSDDTINIVDLSYRKTLEIDGKGSHYFSMTINSNAEKIILKNLSVESTETILSVNNVNATIYLESCSFAVTAEGVTAVRVKAQNCSANISGYCEIKGGPSANGFEAYNLFFAGTGELTIKGGSAINYGQNGGSGLVAKRVSFNDALTSTIVGGNGAEGAKGYDGQKGRDAEFMQTSTGGSAGGQGQTGGNGGNAVECTDIEFGASTCIVLQGGDAANGGRGGNGGNAGKRIFPGTTKGGKGGAGGDAGKAGLALSLGNVDDLSEFPNNVTIIDGKPCKQGERGTNGKDSHVGW